ncbi:nucleotidyltransferase family protein [Alteromonas sp. D210916BOD_24]|uniref:nucleotidyltransferase family protein n=1 Tax=Alteromonas sp. D210916BOD_24 TaxID=3157618 RepID=UPI00399CA8A3
MPATVTPSLLHSVKALLKADALRMRCLSEVRRLDLPQAYIGAGFLRNAIWDWLYHKPAPTPLNDVDVVYFCDVPKRYCDKLIEAQLNERMPEVNWQVKNQALMHLVHGHRPYRNCEHAISYWVERETCVAVQLTQHEEIKVLAPYGLDANFAGTISINPRFPRPDVFTQRVKHKGWLTQWPQLACITSA